MTLKATRQFQNYRLIIFHVWYSKLPYFLRKKKAKTDKLKIMENAHGWFLKAKSRWFCFYDIDYNLIKSEYKGSQHMFYN